MLKYLSSTLRLILLGLCLACSTHAARAQVPGGLTLPVPPAVLQPTDEGLFVLQNGVLAKFEAQTLQPLGTLRLLPPLPAVVQSDDPAARASYFREVSQHLAAAVIIPHKEALLIVQGDELFRVDAKRMKVEVTTNLAPNTRQNSPMQLSSLFRPPTPPVFQTSGDLLYLIRSGEVIVVDMPSGKINARNLLPAEMQPQSNLSTPPVEAEQG